MDKKSPEEIVALFVGYEDQENLGLRSIIAYLRSYGINSDIIPLGPNDTDDVIRVVKRLSPALVGFSIIFQYTLDHFVDITFAMREAGIDAHFTVGGHFPSIRPREVLDAMPHIDSIVCFEGEYTTRELIENLNEPKKWPSISGLAFRKNSEVVINKPRPLIMPLDSLPLPSRNNYRQTPQGLKIASILASRGCLHNCSFCSIRQFYGTPEGPLRRVRSPANVVSEMRNLHESENVRFFIFQDDDFAAKSKQQRKWIDDFLAELELNSLVNKIAWRISCRADDIDAELFIKCRKYGLISVFMGIESGNDEGLKTLNKLTTVEQNLSAVDTLNQIGLPYEIGFMLFDPLSTIEALQENIAFLRRIAADGSCSMPFNKMLPYAGTPIEKKLKSEGRLKGTMTNPDYDFIDSRINFFSLFVSKVFRFRNFDELGLVERLRAARAVQLLIKLFDAPNYDNEYYHALLKIIAKTNVTALNTLENALDFFASRNLFEIVNDWSMLNYLSEFEFMAENQIRKELDQVLAKYNPAMLDAYKKEYARRPPPQKPDINHKFNNVAYI